MPRPQRVREREQTRAAKVEADEPPIVATEQGANDAIDNADEHSQSARTGQVVPEGELELARSVARRLGWVPQEEWKRDPTKWADADRFLEDTPRQIETLKERLRRQGQVSDAVAEDARRQGLREAEERLRAATRAGDEDGVVTAAHEVAKHAAPHPQTVAWIGRNPWFNEDPTARLVAAEAIKRAEQRGATVADALEAGETEVRRRFPEHFDAPEPKREVRLSQVQTPPPQVQGGSRGGGATQRTKEPGWGDIPSADRNGMANAIKRTVRNHGLTEDAARTKLAEIYWRNQA